MVVDLKKLQEENKKLKNKKKNFKKLKTKKEKILKKPTAKIPSYSSKKFISNLAQQQGGLVSQQDPQREKYENPEQDNRSLFFKEMFKQEKKKSFGGFI